MKKQMTIHVEIAGWQANSGWEYRQDLDPYEDEVEVLTNGSIKYEYSALDYIQDSFEGDLNGAREAFEEKQEQMKDTEYTLYVIDDDGERIDLDSDFESKFWENRN